MENIPDVIESNEINTAEEIDNNIENNNQED